MTATESLAAAHATGNAEEFMAYAFWYRTL
jgi:hypothetical protein